jgi:hypothetical protein
MTTRVVTRLPEGIELPCELACGPLPSVWSGWEGCGRPLIADPVERLREAHRNWAASGQAWSVGLGCSRNAWISLLSPLVLETVSAEGRQRAEDLARMRVVPQR